MDFSITNVNTYSKSFDFLVDEPDIYSKEDLVKLFSKKKIGESTFQDPGRVAWNDPDCAAWAGE